MKRSPISLRHRALCGWLKGNEPELFNNTLKLQKFLFFYECFSIIEGDPEVDIKNLKGYKMGPVFSDIYGALKYGKDDFIEYLPKAYATYNKKINKERVLLSAFIVKIMKKDELSEFTHSLNIWKSQENEIKNRKKGEKAVDLNLSDLNQRDIAVLQMLKTMCIPAASIGTKPEISFWPVRCSSNDMTAKCRIPWRNY